jgi:hypothetical protein
MAQSFRHFWGPQVSGRFNFNWDIIKHDSIVVITASEGPGYDVQPAPQKFVGDAVCAVASVAPHDGGVTFAVLIVFDPGRPGDRVAAFVHPINLWTDITVFDPSEFEGQN